MAALERDLESVLADERDILYAKLVGVETLDASKPSRRAGLAATFRAWARPAKLLGRVAAAMPALPPDDHDLALAIDVDRKRKRVGVPQRATGR